MDLVLAVLAALGATVFSVDLVGDLERRYRPHLACYALGITLFAAATWALVIGLAAGWSAPVFDSFYLFGAVVNIPVLAVGSVYLVIGPRAGKAAAMMVTVFAALALFAVFGTGFTGPFPAEGVPSGREIYAAPWPRIAAGIGSGVGATALIALALVSALRFRRSNRRLVVGNLLIVAGTFAASLGGFLQARDVPAAFPVSLLLAVTLIWAGFRVASGARSKVAAGPPAD